jgi:cell cycle sensor histidine kinase DivJ
MEKVLSPFGQAADSYDRRHGGMGLGLPLTRELVALLGGEFELRSRPGEGTVALVRLPLTVPTDTAGDGRAASSAAG